MRWEVAVGPLQWGDVPTALGTCFAGGAAWFAYQTIKSQRQQINEQREFIAEQTRFMAEQQQNLVLERAELQDQAEERRISQARDVAMISEARGSTTIDEYGDADGYDSWLATVLNRSRDPIHDVVVRFGDAYNADSVTDLKARHPDSGSRPVPAPLIPGGGEFAFFSPRWSEGTVRRNRPVLFFTDDNGARWRLDSYGKLEEVLADGA
ncbi:hypothetical protein AB0D59_01225 [Streptomyces sp. NPDC048417]|uniref:hypothetical protein n=1 Tax=Streptomyces sp. NPDC048417 TaxID=3155387 RepID=UPI00341FB8E8